MSGSQCIFEWGSYLTQIESHIIYPQLIREKHATTDGLGMRWFISVTALVDSISSYTGVSK